MTISFYLDRVCKNNKSQIANARTGYCPMWSTLPWWQSCTKTSITRAKTPDPDNSHPLSAGLGNQ